MITTEKPAAPPLLVGAREAAAMLSISTRTLWTLTQRGELRSVRVGRAVRYSTADLQAFADGGKGVSR